MFNRDGIHTTKYGAPRQILANVEFQYSVGCIVPETMGESVDGKTIVKAGTPLNIDLTDTLQPVKAAASGSPMNAVLLHDVDVTNAADNANGTALVFGFINLNRVDATVAGLLTSAKAETGASPLLTLVKL